MRVLTQGSQEGAGEGGKRGYQITLFDECKNATSALLEGRGYRITLFDECKNARSALLEGRGIELHSSTNAKMKGQHLWRGGGIELHTSTNAKMQRQQFGGEGVSGYSLAHLQKCMISNIEYQVSRLFINIIFHKSQRFKKRY